MGKAMLEAANNPGGGGAAEGMGLGMGWAMANRMGQMAGAGGVATAPPPPPAAWHLAANGQSKGPFSEQQLLQAVQSGELKATTLVWSPALGNWTAAGQVPQLGYLFSGPPAPPPVPPAS
jgi:hypothetical protein